MRLSPLLLAVPALSMAQQFPLFDQVKSFLGRASSTINSVTPAISIPNPIASAAKKIASLKVTPLTLSNYADFLAPSTTKPGIEEAMILVTGGNKTCYGMCKRAETAFNESVALIEASRQPPRLAMLDCEDQGVLCNSWLADRPAIMHILIPKPAADQSKPETTVRFIHLNRTTITAPEIAALHLREKYKETEPYEGLLHPFDGGLAKMGLLIPAGYAITGLSKIPTYAFMIGFSFLSRTFMSRRRAPQQPRPQGGAAPAAAT